MDPISTDVAVAGGGLAEKGIHVEMLDVTQPIVTTKSSIMHPCLLGRVG